MVGPMNLELSRGIDARSIYVMREDNELMLSRIVAGSGGGAAVEPIQTALDNFEEYRRSDK